VSRSKPKTLIVSTEVSPFGCYQEFSAQADVAEMSSGLARALADGIPAEGGLDVTVVTPINPHVSAEHHALARRLSPMTVEIGGESLQVGILEGKLGPSHAKVLIIDDGMAHEEISLGELSEPALRRLAVFSAAALQTQTHFGQHYEVIHAIGWQAALVPVLALSGTYGGEAAQPKTVLTCIDPTQTGGVPQQWLASLGLDEALPEGLDFCHQGKASLLKAGILCADVVTVTSTHAAKQLETEASSDSTSLFAEVGGKLAGVAGGLDYAHWTPENDRSIVSLYASSAIAAKHDCKRFLLDQAGLPLAPDAPLCVVTGKLDREQGIQILLDSADAWIKLPFQLVFAGSAAPEIAVQIAQLVAKTPRKVAHIQQLSGDSMHAVLAGADSVLISTPGDPIGALELKAMSFGAIPVAQPVGRLCDTVVDYDCPSETGCGLLFGQGANDSLIGSLQRLISLYRSERHWPRLVQNAMRQRFDWATTAAHYAGLYATTT